MTAISAETRVDEAVDRLLSDFPPDSTPDVEFWGEQFDAGLAWVHFPVELTEGRAEDIPLDDHAVDHVVMTWTLCSVADPAQTLAEVRRVLPPGGSLEFNSGKLDVPATGKTIQFSFSGEAGE